MQHIMAVLPGTDRRALLLLFAVATFLRRGDTDAGQADSNGHHFKA
jgi:hypothetical protein